MKTMLLSPPVAVGSAVQPARVGVLSPSVLFARTDDSAGGWLQTTKRRVKFGWRYLLHGCHVESAHHWLHRHGLGQIVETDPYLLLRPLRSYLWTGLDADGRAQALRAHLDWLAQHPKESVLQFYRRGHSQVAELQRDTRVVQLCLEPGRRLGREGELELHLKLDDQLVMQAAFSVLPHTLAGHPTPGWVMVIGNMQGGPHGPDPVKALTQLAERIRPRALLMTALQGLAAGWQLSGIQGVSDAGHAYAGYGSLSKRVSASYDELWQDLGASRLIRTSHWELPVQLAFRPEDEIPSRKRAEYRRRNALRQQIFDCCAAAAVARLA